MTKKKTKEELLNELSPATLHAAMKAALEDNEEIDDSDDTEEGRAANAKRREKNNNVVAGAAAKLGIPRETIDALGDNFVTHRGLKGREARVWANEEALSLFEAINNDDAVSVKNLFDTIIRERIANRIEEAKVEVAYRGTILEDDDESIDLSMFSDEQLEDILNMEDEELAEILAESDAVIGTFLENVEQLDELSPATLHSALSKALEDNLEIDDDPENDEATKKANKKIREKNNYVAAMAAAKLGVPPEAFEKKFGDSHPGIKGLDAKVWANEEVEDDGHSPFEVNELSRKLLGRYMNSANKDIKTNNSRFKNAKSEEMKKYHFQKSMKRSAGHTMAFNKGWGAARVQANEESLSDPAGFNDTLNKERKKKG